jgi:hypothetical protein
MSSPAGSASPTGPPSDVAASGAGGPPAGASPSAGAGASTGGGPPAGAGGGGPPAGAGGGGPPPVQLSPLELTAKKIVETNKRVNIGSYLIG